MKRLLVFLAMLAPLSAALAAPSVLVRTASMQREALAETLTGYGRVSPDIGSTVDINLPADKARLPLPKGNPRPIAIDVVARCTA